MEGGGEIIVTSLVLARILVSLVYHGLLYESAGLVFLSLVALLVELAASKHHKFKQFNPRSGTSSGVFIGSLSVPFVLVARLCQQTRMASTLGTSRDEEFESSRLEFWSAIASSVSLLVLVWRQTLSYPKAKGNKKAFINSMSYWTTCCAIIPFLAFVFPLKLTSAAFLVITSTQLFDYEIQAFPFCASLGEAILVSNGLSVYSINAFAYTLSKIGLMCVPWIDNFFGTVFAFVLRSSKVCPMKSSEKVRKAASFYMALSLSFVIVTAGWLNFIHGLDSFVIIWVVEFVFQDPQRLYLCGYWVCVLSLSVVPFYMVKSTKVAQIMVRKVFHFMVVVMFVPALAIQQDFLKLAFSVALAGFLVFEMIRVLQIPPLGEFVHKYMTAFTDTRDSDLLIISHFSLLLGCALPLWLTSSMNDRPLAPYAGVFSLGIGDTMASVAGYNFGSIRLTSNSKKTLEGAIAGTMSMLLTCLATHCMFIQPSLSIAEWTSLMVAVLCTGFMEAYTTQLDNVFLPLMFYGLLVV